MLKKTAHLQDKLLKSIQFTHHTKRIMEGLETVEIKAFVPAKDFGTSKQFYEDIGFVKASESSDIAYFYYGNCSFLLQNTDEEELPKHYMMHLLVRDIQRWHQSIKSSGIEEIYQVKMTEIESQAWGMQDFMITDPSGVIWRIAENNALT